ncbi:dermonecrotic toxin domain-containing protein [Pseudomonas gingeri]|uniref:dermonecrotic toxin domain-containing protein n=1 Tax=Pseudomonas gingeri TaxID=117681 RepID=UPI00211607EA|nr:DUF6543 domain-containing protein [Pseudomonas gingeri]
MSQTVEHSIDTGDEPPPRVPTEADEPLLSAFLQRDAGLLHSEKSWTQQQVVEQLAVSFKAAMGPLHEAEQRTWPGLYRQLMAARSVLDEESRAVVDAFEIVGVARLRARLKQASGLDLDPHTTYLHTVIDLPAQVQQPLAEGPPVQVESFERRIGTVTVSTMTLWQAACLNFAFSDSSYANLKRRWISRERKVDINDRRWLLATEAFVRIVRELDLGAVLKPHVEQAMRVDGPLDRSILAFAQAEIHFGLYDSARQPAATGLTYHAFTALRDELSMTHPRLKGSYVALRLPGGLMAGLDRVLDTIESKLLHLFAIDYEPLEAIYLPLLIFEIVGRAGLYSYCVDRPGGALRFHDSRAAFERDFKAQLQADSAGQRLRWLIPSLAFKQQHQFWQWIKAHSKPKGITWFSTFRCLRMALAGGRHPGPGLRVRPDDHRFQPGQGPGRVLRLALSPEYPGNRGSQERARYAGGEGRFSRRHAPAAECPDAAGAGRFRHSGQGGGEPDAGAVGTGVGRRHRGDVPGPAEGLGSGTGRCGHGDPDRWRAGLCRACRHPTLPGVVPGTGALAQGDVD